jgi:hypothetical protein
MVTLLAVSALGLLAVVVTAARDRRDLAFTIGVAPTAAAATLAPGETVCQTPISVSESFSRVRLTTGGPGGAGEPLAVSVRASDGGRLLGRSELPGRFPDRADLTATVGPVAAGQKVAVCARNAGDRPAIVYGNATAAHPPSEAMRGERPLGTDLAVVFLKADDRSMLSELPDVLGRASLFRPGWVGTWTFWALAAAALLGVPLLLAGALAATRDAAPREAPPAQDSAPAP